ncbi:hypothetical protein [Ferrovibrio sp.]|uniref:hypothetical protein n=1 Tax=Ferrovibrio sp. TaxID=1917215 RepID=UPI0035B4EAAA
MIKPPPLGWLADEIQAPSLLELNAWYTAARGANPLAPVDAVGKLTALPAADDLGLVEIMPDGSYLYRQIGPAYAKLSELRPDADGLTRETRAVMRQHLDLACSEAKPFHVSITRWDGPRILQYDRLILPLGDAGGIISHLLIGEAFLRVARG